MVSISKNNKKMGSIPSISFPPIITCGNCQECAKKCYALKMAKFRPSIGTAWENNLKEWKNNPQAVKFAILNASITSGYFRYFVGGDIINTEFLKMMVEVAETVKTCQFLAFTKKYELVNDFIKNGGKIPDNLHLIFSEWDKAIRNPYNLAKSKVIFKGEAEPQNDKICGGNCIDCICKGVACWTLKSGETIHFYEH